MVSAAFKAGLCSQHEHDADLPFHREVNSDASGTASTPDGDALAALRHILIIDDDAAIRDLTEFVLTSYGFAVSTAANGRHGLRRCEEQEPDLVITDIVMPEMEGLETIRALRKRYVGLPILAMSGGGESGQMNYLDVAGKFGATETLPKPFEIDALLAAVNRCWEKSPPL